MIIYGLITDTEDENVFSIVFYPIDNIIFYNILSNTVYNTIIIVKVTSRVIKRRYSYNSHPLTLLNNWLVRCHP
jgi:hypothetical protein